MFMMQRGMQLPPDWPAGFTGPAATGIPGETRTVPLQKLFAKVVSAGGSERLSSTPGGWAIVASQLELAVGPSTSMGMPHTVPKPSEVPGRLAGYYMQRLAPFEHSWVAAQRRNGQQENQQQPQQPQQEQQPGPAQQLNMPPGFAGTPRQQPAQPPMGIQTPQLGGMQQPPFSQPFPPQQEGQRPPGQPMPPGSMPFGDRGQTPSSQSPHMGPGGMPAPKRETPQPQGGGTPGQPGQAPGPAPPPNPFSSMEPPQVQFVVSQQMKQLQQLVFGGNMTPQQAAARYTAIQQALQAYNLERAQRAKAPAPSMPQPPADAGSTTPKMGPPAPWPPTTAPQPQPQAPQAAAQLQRTPSVGPGSPAPMLGPHASGPPKLEAPPAPAAAPPSAEQIRNNPAAQQALQMLQHGNLNPMQHQLTLSILRSALGQGGDAKPSPTGAPPSAPPSAGVPAARSATAAPSTTAAETPTAAPAPPAPAASPAPQARSPGAAAAPSGQAQQPRKLGKTKIEYVPWHHELQTYGGRDLDRIERELVPHLGTHTQVRGVRELGTVDIHALSMSLKSRLDSEVSYVLNALLVLTAGVDAAPHFQLQLAACEDLLDVLLDVLMENAFLVDTAEAAQLLEEPGTDAVPDGLLQEQFTTYCEALELALQDEGEARLWRRQGSAEQALSLEASRREHELDRKVAVMLTTLTVLRNLALMPDNAPFLAHHDRFLRAVAALCRHIQLDPRLTGDAAAARGRLGHLSLRETLQVRKDALAIVQRLAGTELVLNGHSVATMATFFDLLRFFVLDAGAFEEREGASHLFEQVPVPGAVPSLKMNPEAYRAPLHADAALQALSRFALLDVNREALAAWVPAPIVVQLAHRLVRLLPVTDTDFQRLGSETRLEYIESVALCLYNIVYLAPPSVKATLSGTGGTPRLLFRTVRRLLGMASDYTRNPFSILCRRLVETLRLLSDAEDMFGEPPLLGMYWPAHDDAGASMNAEQGESKSGGMSRMRTGLLVAEDSAVMEVLLSVPNVDSTVADDLQALVKTN